jgi:hypothetical protein
VATSPFPLVQPCSCPRSPPQNPSRRHCSPRGRANPEGLNGRALEGAPQPRAQWQRRSPFPSSCIAGPGPTWPSGGGGKHRRWPAAEEMEEKRGDDRDLAAREAAGRRHPSALCAALLRPRVWRPNPSLLQRQRSLLDATGTASSITSPRGYGSLLGRARGQAAWSFRSSGGFPSTATASSAPTQSWRAAPPRAREWRRSLPRPRARARRPKQGGGLLCPDPNRDVLLLPEHERAGGLSPDHKPASQARRRPAPTPIAECCSS